jgi:carboxypeptidase T
MVEHNNYIAQKSSDLYPASGDSDDYMYIEDLDVKPEIYAFTPEVGSEADGFWPQQTDITEICQGMNFPNLILAHLTHNYYQVKDISPSSIVDVTGILKYQALKLGLENQAISVSITPLVDFLK